jgi:hypothetical protein
MRYLMSALFVLLFSFPALAWNFDKHLIPTDEIMSGGPPRDGIPALMSPAYVVAAKADFMRDKDQVIGVVVNDVARAYPLRIMSWHELVNDNFGGLPLLVSW